MWNKIKARRELAVAALGLLMVWMIAQFSDTSLADWVWLVVAGLALIYTGMIVWKPIQLPHKAPQPLSWQAVLQAGGVILPVALVAALVNIGFSLLAPEGSEGSPSWFFLYLVLLVVLGSAGLAAERSLEIDLFPVLRRRQVRWMVYVPAAAFFFTLTQIFVTNLLGELFARIGQALGDQPVPLGSAAGEFEFSSPLLLLAQMLVGAGIFEELLFRVGIMTLVWGLTGRWKLGLLVSALFFGLYHISPFSGIETYLAAPVAAVLSSFTVGIYTGLVYRYRGFTAAVLMHSLGNWFMILLFSGAFT